MLTCPQRILYICCMAIETVPAERCTCDRCGYGWFREGKLVERCPKCKSFCWNRPPIRKRLTEEKTAIVKPLELERVVAKRKVATLKRAGVKTCAHGTPKGTRCWQCGGIAKLE